MANYPQCQGQRKDGRPCTSPLVGADGYCFAHSPTRTAERQAAQQRGGQHRASVVRLHRLVPPRLLPIFDRLEAALGEVHDGTLSPGQAMAMAALARALVAVLTAGEVEQRLRELEGRAG
jgi:hypothetical protein